MAALRLSPFDEVSAAPSVDEQVLGNLASELESFRASRPTSPFPPGLLAKPSASAPEGAGGSGEEVSRASAATLPPRTQAEETLSSKQLDLLRRLAQCDEPVSREECDARVLNALIRKGLVEVTSAGARATESGYEHFRTRVRKRRRVGSHRAVVIDGRDRAEMILQAIRDLEQALPGQHRLRVGDLSSDTSEVLTGLRHFAEQVREGKHLP